MGDKKIKVLETIIYQIGVNMVGQPIYAVHQF